MKISRRDFVRTVAIGSAGLVVGFNGRGIFAADAAKQFAPNGWVKIDIDGTVTLTIGKSEMGQGVRTSLAMILAEELEADWSRIKLVQASPSPVFDDLGTGGSDSVRSGWRSLRKAGAAARARCSPLRQRRDGKSIAEVAPLPTERSFTRRAAAVSNTAPWWRTRRNCPFLTTCR